MKKIIIGIGTAFVLLIAWFIRYLIVNHGNINAYNAHTAQEYQMRDTVSFETNQCYYLYELNDYDISVNSAEIVNFNDFCYKYQKSIDDFLLPSEKYLELEVIITNRTSKKSEFPFLPLIIKGTDWWCSYSFEATEFANNSMEFNREYGQITGIDIPDKKTVNLKIVYELPRNMFINTVWNNIEKENIWLILTIAPIEQRIKIML